MSARPALLTATRALGNTLRPSAIAGPSRIPIPISLLRHSSSSSSSGSSSSRLATEICVRTAKPFPSILHALAILRAVEASYGRVINLQVHRDMDSLLPTNVIFMTLLEPIDISKRLLHEIPAPVSSLGDKERYGGPSLADVRSVLASTPQSTRSRPTKSSHTGSRGSTQDQGGMITFEIEARKNAGRTKKMRDDPTYREMTMEMIREDEEILDALEQFGGGFFGGFEGVASEHRKVLQRLRASREKPSGGVTGAPRSGAKDGQVEGGERGAALEEAVSESTRQAEAVQV